MTNDNDMHESSSKLMALIRAIDLQTNARLAEAKKHNLGQRAQEIALLEADNAKRQLRSAQISYEAAVPSDVATARRPENAFKLVRIRGTLGKMEEPHQVDIPRAESTLVDLMGELSSESDHPAVKALMSRITITGEGTATIETQAFIDRKLVTCLQDHGQRFANWEFLLLVVPGTEFGSAPAGTGMTSSATISSYHFYLVDARPLISAIQMVGPTPGEIEAGLRRYATDPHVLDSVTAAVVRFLEIKCLDRLPLLHEAIRFQVLAAATEGLRAHTLLIGPPSVGKSKVHKAAKLVQPVFRFALPTKVTEAGLIGDGHSNAKQRRPGLIPQCHTGLFSVEDFNQANSLKNQRFCAVFTHTMAEGRVSDASAARVEYHAEVSILLDANRKSDVRKVGTDKEGFERVVADIGVPMNVLSRMTYIAEIPRDPKTQLVVTSAMIAQTSSLPSVERQVLEEQLRQFQVYAALMRERHARVEISADVRRQIEKYVLAACNTTESHFERHSEFADFMTRLGQQALMLVQAHARLHNRGEAVLADVDAIFPFLWRKLDWVKTTLFGGQAETAVVDANAMARRTLIRLRLKKWPEPTCTPQQIQRQLGLQSASLATIADDLRSLLGDPDGTDVFCVTTSERIGA
jgi:hypothetical protein